MLFFVTASMLQITATQTVAREREFWRHNVVYVYLQKNVLVFMYANIYDPYPIPFTDTQPNQFYTFSITLWQFRKYFLGPMLDENEHTTLDTIYGFFYWMKVST